MKLSFRASQEGKDPEASMVWMAAMAQGETQDFQEKTVIWDQGVLMYVKGIPAVHMHFPSKLTALKMALRLWHQLYSAAQGIPRNFYSG